MKLIFCPICKDVVRLHVTDEPRKCICGRSWGRYLNPGRAEIGGRAVALGIKTMSLMRAAEQQPETGAGMPIEAFVFAKDAHSVERV